MIQKAIIIIFFLGLSCCNPPELQIISLNNVSVSKWLGGNQSALTFTWDDGNPNHYSIIYPMFSKRGLKCSFFINTNTLEVYGENYKEISDGGFEIGSHTVNHLDITKLDFEEVLFELTESKKAIFLLTNQNPVTFVHPFNNTNLSTNKLVFKNYLFSRWATIAEYSDRSILTIMENSTTNELFDHIKTSNQDKKWLIFAGHSVNGNGYSPMQSSILEQLLNYITINNKHIWIDTFKKIALYEETREHTKIGLITVNKITIDDSNVRLKKFKEFGIEKIPLTIKLNYSKEYDFTGDNIIEVKYEKKDYFVTINLLLGNTFSYSLKKE